MYCLTDHKRSARRQRITVIFYTRPMSAAVRPESLGNCWHTNWYHPFLQTRHSLHLPAAWRTSYRALSLLVCLSYNRRSGLSAQRFIARHNPTAEFGQRRLWPCEINDSRAESRHSAAGGLRRTVDSTVPLIPRRGLSVSLEFSRMFFCRQTTFVTQSTVDKYSNNRRHCFNNVNSLNRLTIIADRT